MATIVEELAIALGYAVDDSALSKHEKAAKAAAKRVGESWDKIGQAATKAGAAATVAIGSLAALAIKSAAAATAIGDLSKRSGASTADVQRLGYALRQTGGDAGQLGDILKTLNKSVADARSGSGPAADAFKAIGVSLKSLEGRGAEEQIGILADGFAKLQDDASRTSVSMALFGDAGTKMIPLLSGGSATVRGLGDELQKLGGVLDKDAIAKSAKFTAEVEKAKVKIGAFVTEAGLGLVPLVQSAGEDWERWAIAVGGFGVAIGGLKLAAFAQGLGLVGTSLAAIRWGAGIAGAAALGVAIGTAADEVLRLSDGIAGLDDQKRTRGAGPVLGDLPPELQATLARETARRDNLDGMLKGNSGVLGFMTGLQSQRDDAQAKIDAITSMGSAQQAARDGAAAVAAAEQARRVRAREMFGALSAVGSDALGGLSDVGSALGGTLAVTAEGVRNTGRGAFSKPKRRGGGGKVDDSAAKMAAMVAALHAETQVGAQSDLGGTGELGEFLIGGSGAQLPAIDDELLRAGQGIGARDKAIQTAIESAAQAHAAGESRAQVRKRGFDSLAGSTGVDFSKRHDAIMSAVFGTDQLPDIPISDLEQGQTPQVLQATINNTYTVSVNNTIDGTREPSVVAEVVADRVRSLFGDEIEKVSKFSKTPFAR